MTNWNTGSENRRLNDDIFQTHLIDFKSANYWNLYLSQKNKMIYSNNRGDIAPNSGLEVKTRKSKLQSRYTRYR